MIGHAGRPDARHVVLKADVRRRDANRRRDELLRSRDADALRQLWAVELRETRRAVEPHATADRADRLLKHDDRVALARAVEPRRRQADRRADGRVAGEGKLARRREDAHARRMRRVLGRQHEDRLRQIELARDRLHRLAVETLGIEHDGERVPGKRPVGEYVEDFVAAFHVSSSNASRRTRAGIVNPCTMTEKTTTQ